MDSPFHILASHPFNRPNADVVLRSTDGVEFRVRGDILEEASPVLERAICNLKSSDGEATIEFDAESSTLDSLLRICYPIRKGKVEHTVDKCFATLTTAIAYEMELPIEVLEEELVAIARRSTPHALKVWAGSCRLRLESLVRGAADCLFGDEPLDMGSLSAADFEGLTAGEVFRLREYRRMRGQVGPGFSLLPRLPPLQAQVAVPLEDVDLPPLYSDGDIITVVPGSDPCESDFECVSSDGVTFYVNRDVVSTASSYIKDAIFKSLDSIANNKTRKKKGGTSSRSVPIIAYALHSLSVGHRQLTKCQ